MAFNFYMPAKVIFGAGRIKKLSRERMPGRKALVVTQKLLVDLGVADTVLQQLRQMELEYVVFDEVTNPTTETVERGCDILRTHHCDFVIGIGGGSNIDTAKAIAIMATNPGVLWDYISNGTGKGNRLKNKPLPIVAISTTAGTGSETDNWTVMTNPETKEKISFGTPDAFPILTVVDPELMVGIPPAFTAYQGFDAFFHSAEHYICCKIANKLTDMFAVEAVETACKALSRAVKDGKDVAAREDLAYSSMLGGFIMSMSSTSSQHSLEHAISAAHPEIPHGAGLLMLSEAYFTFIAKSGKCNERMVHLAGVMGIPDAKDPMDFVKALTELQTACGVRDLKLSDYGVKRNELPEIARRARILEPAMFALDRVALTDEDSLSILESAYR